MAIELSQRIQQVKPSATLAVSSKAAELRAKGQDVIGLGVGEPDFDTPQHIKDAAIQALRDGFTRYTPVDGIPSVKQAIVDKLSRDNQLTYTPKQVVVSTGAKQCLYNVMQALLNPGDEVIIPAPYWVSYPDMALLADAKPVTLTTTIEQGFKITPAQLSEAITPKTRMFIINSPSNPTGLVYSAHELKGLAEVLLAHPQITIVTDDIYEHMIWHKDGFNNIVNVCPELYDRTVVINGVSKAYAMTGWRIGYAAGPDNVIAAMKKIQSQSTSNACAIAQKASEAALNGDQTCVATMLKSFKERHDYVFAALNEMPTIKCLPADGTFYLFPDISQALNNLPGINNDVEFANYLLEKVGVALVPGSAFGAPNCIRLSFAVSKDTLTDALARLQKALTG